MYTNLEKDDWGFVIRGNGILKEVLVPHDESGTEADCPTSVREVLEILTNDKDISFN